MTDKKEIKKYCSGIDCLTCDEAEPCIYRIANKLQEQLKRKEEEVKELNLVNKRLGAELCGKLQNYMRALDKIEKIVKQTCSQRCTNDCLGTRKHCGYGRILTIINKIKE